MYQGQRILPQKRVGKDYVNGKIGQGDGYGEEKRAGEVDSTGKIGKGRRPKQKNWQGTRTMRQ